MNPKINAISEAETLLVAFDEQRIAFLTGLGQQVNTDTSGLRSGAVGDKAYWEWEFIIDGVQIIASKITVFSNERGTGYDISVDIMPDGEAYAYMTRLCPLDQAPAEVFSALSRMIFNVMGFHDE